MRTARIELALSAWKADVLPLNYVRKKRALCDNVPPLCITGSAKNIVTSFLVFRERESFYR